jgi:hypothetical protein
MANNKSTEEPFEQSENVEHMSSDVTPKEPTEQVVNIEKKPRKTIKPPRIQHPKSDDENSVDKSDDEDTFEDFIISNFNPFSGDEDVIEWLDATDEKFWRLKITSKLQYVAIPFLVTGKAKRIYLRNEGKIQTYNNFYSLMLTQYDVSSDNAPRHSTPSFTSTASQGNIPQNIPTQQNVVFDDQRQSSNQTFDILDGSLQPPILRSTALHDRGATGVAGNAPVSRSNILPSQNSLFNTSQLDQTSDALLRAVVDSIIKNPKTFRGGQEDVQQWLEDIEQAFDTAQIPESLNIDLVQHSLRGEAFHWYKKRKKKHLYSY